MLDPRIIIDFRNLIIEGKHIVALSIHMTAGRPVAFKGARYIRSGSSVKNLAEYPEKERELWRSFDARTFEMEFARTDCSPEEILMKMEDDFIIEKSDSNYNITNLGAYTFAKDLREFEDLRSHAVRVIRYNGVNKLSAISDTAASK